MKALSGTPTCYIFACPQSESAPFHVLIPTGPNREPGLILASTRGELRLWGGIGIGLAGGEHYTTTELPLQGDGDEYLTTLTRIDVRCLLDRELTDMKLNRATRAKPLWHRPPLGDCSDSL